MQALWRQRKKKRYRYKTLLKDFFQFNTSKEYIGNMFSIRRILDSSAPANRIIVAQVQDILRAQFGAIKESEILDLPKKLNDALKYRFQSRLLIAQRKNDSVLGFALMMHATDIGFCYLDFMAAGKKLTGQGLGGALYEKVRDEASAMGASCILMECLPDDPALSPDPVIRRQNVRRLNFYARYGAYPITGTLYETPVKEGDTDPPYLVIDTLGQPLPDGKMMRKAVRAILERKYGDMCDTAYINKVVKSFPLSGISLREPKNIQNETITCKPCSEQFNNIVLIANEGHEIHHIREHGYVESPVRIKVVLRELEKLSFIQKKTAKSWPDKHILGVHDADYVSFLNKACMSVPKGKSVYPYVFPIRNQDRKPIDTPLLAGYYCIDTFTPLNADAYKAARSAVDCALSGAEEIISGVTKTAYALVRPPGHHAERKSFGGFCYFANAAIAANYLSQYGKVAILDIDYHHGNSQQDIFYKRGDVLTVSLHGHPKFAYPYFTGFADEMGEGPGYGYNLNMPLPEHLEVQDYLKYLGKAVKRIEEYNPAYLVVALGLDTAKADPTGTWPLRAADFNMLGEAIGAMSLPTLVVQEGGYRTQTLGINARHFFTGLHKATNKAKPKKTIVKRKNLVDSGPRIRRIVKLSDVETIRDLVKESGIFSAEEIAIAAELVAEAALKGEKKSGYSFVFLEEAGKILGYACFGRIPLTEDSFDLYWLVMSHRRRNQGFAGQLLALSEEAIKSAGGTQIFAETSSRQDYAPARAFYKKAGFVQCALQKNFYRAEDDKVTFMKHVK
jgi:acetoin utilization deacetylase AcuC-like enzyme/GNAT superfamily N-acetyltransferase